MIKSNSPMLKDKKQLLSWFIEGYKDKKYWKIGTEHEKFGYIGTKGKLDSYKPMEYHGDSGIQVFFKELSRHGWTTEKEGNNIIALFYRGQSITLEPGGQIELSGAPLESIHETCKEANDHLELLKKVGKKLNIVLIGIGSRPKENISDIDWMPKERYKIMKKYMPKKGKLGIHMMANTCTVQANLDYSSELDMIRKFRVALSVQPIITALFSNSPFTHGQPNGYLSWRRHIWTDTDPDRCGIMPFVFNDDFGFEKYINFALRVPMYFIKRNGRYIDCSGSSFELFMHGKLEQLPGEFPTIEDWESHLTTIFTEVRLKRYIEMRGADAGSWKRICALPAFWVGLLYSSKSLQGAEEICSAWDNKDREKLAQEVPRLGLRAKIKGNELFNIANDLLKLSKAGLKERSFLDGAGNDEVGYLSILEEIIKRKVTPAEELLEKFNSSWNEDINKVFEELSY